MAFHIEVCKEFSLTKFAGKSLLSFMYFNVFVQIGFLSEAVIASLYWAGVGSLLGVDPQVIEEVVPFAKKFSAAFLFTFEYLDVPL